MSRPVVLEHALFSIRPGSQGAFEAALREARLIISASPGFRALELHRGIESPDQFLLLVEWETLEDHVVGFRESDAFTAWRAVISPYFASPPVMEHFVAVDGLGRS